MPKHATTEITHELDRLYDLRADDAATVTAIVRLVDRHARRRALSYDLLWRLSRAEFFLGQCAADKLEEARAHHAAGAHAGTLAARLEESHVEGHFWAGVNLALRAQVECGWQTLPLKLSLALRARYALRRAVRLDASYHGAGPLRVLARLESNLPELFGGGVRRAVENFERAVTLAPTNTVTRRYFAELLLDLRARDEAIVHLRAICDAPPCAQWNYEITRDKRWANSPQQIELLARRTD